MLEELKRELGEYLAGSDGAELALSLAFDQTAATANLVRCVRLALLAGVDADAVKRRVRTYLVERARADSMFAMSLTSVPGTHVPGMSSGRTHGHG